MERAPARKTSSGAEAASGTNDETNKLLHQRRHQAALDMTSAVLRLVDSTGEHRELVERFINVLPPGVQAELDLSGDINRLPAHQLPARHLPLFASQTCTFGETPQLVCGDPCWRLGHNDCGSETMNLPSFGHRRQRTFNLRRAQSLAPRLVALAAADPLAVAMSCLPRRTRFHS